MWFNELALPSILLALAAISARALARCSLAQVGRFAGKEVSVSNPRGI